LRKKKTPRLFTRFLKGGRIASAQWEKCAQIYTVRDDSQAVLREVRDALSDDIAGKVRKNHNHGCGRQAPGDSRRDGRVSINSAVDNCAQLWIFFMN